jgi:endonuclease/exonuclease/phosphatase family metal-dependent hydrolase
MYQLNRFLLSFIILLVLSNCYANPEVPADISFYSPDSALIKVMTFNIKADNVMGFGSWPSRKPLVVAVIADNAPDIFGLQEPLYNQLEQLQQAFPQYACYWTGGKDGKNEGESCPILYRKDRFGLLDSGTFWFSDQPDVPGTQGWGEPVPRFCSWVVLAEKGKNISFYVYNTHLAWASQRSRNKSVRLIEKEIAARRSSLPFIIMGDFNMKLTNSAGKFLLNSSSENQFPVTDAWLSVHPDYPDMSTCNFGKLAKGPQIDHIQLGMGPKAIAVSIDDRKINGRYPSDHFPVIATIMLPKPPAVRPLPVVVVSHATRPSPAVTVSHAARPSSAVD